MGNDVSIVLHADAPVPSTVLATQHEVHADSDLDNYCSGVLSPPRVLSSPSESRVVERCPRISVMAADKARELLGVSDSATAEDASQRGPSPPLPAQKPPVLLVESCATPDAFITSSTFAEGLNAILNYVEEHRRGGSTATASGLSSSVVACCPIGIHFHPSVCLGNRLRTSEMRTACAEYCNIFLTHLVAALEKVRCDAQAGGGGPSTTTSAHLPMSTVSKGTTVARVPLRLLILYLDARSCRLDDTTGPWLASSLIMHAVRRTRPYALVLARTNAVGGGGSVDGFMTYFSSEVKADMLWASLQHVLLTHNDMSLQGVQTVLENLLAEDAMQDVLLQQQGVDAKAQRSKEVMTAVMQDRLFPRRSSQLLPQLYLVDVRHNHYSDSEVQEVLQNMTPCPDVHQPTLRQGVGAPTVPLQRPLGVNNGAPDVSRTGHNVAGPYDHRHQAEFHTQQAPSKHKCDAEPPPMPYASPAASPQQRQWKNTAAGWSNATPASDAGATAAKQARLPLRNPPHLSVSLQQSVQRLSVSQARESGHNGEQEDVKLTSEASVERVCYSHGGTALETTSASKLSSSETPPPMLSIGTLNPSTAATPTAFQFPQPQKALVAAHLPPSADGATHTQSTLPANEQVQTTSSPLTLRGGVRKMQLQSRPSGNRVRSPQSFPNHSQGGHPTNVNAAATAVEKVPGSLIMKRSGHLLRNLSPHSEAQVKTPIISVTPQQTAVPESPRVWRAHKSAPSPHPLDVLTLQRPHIVGGPPSQVPAPHSTTPRQRTAMSPSKGPSTVARACLTELDPEKYKLGDAEIEVHSPSLHAHCYSHRSSRHRGRRNSDTGCAENEPWLDEVVTQSQGRGTSPELRIGGRRRCYDIPAFAAAAARISPTALERGVRKRHESPAQAASRRAAASTTTSSSSAHRWSKNVYDKVRPCVDSQRDPGDAQLAKAECMAAATIETRTTVRTLRRAEGHLPEELNSRLRYPRSARQHKHHHPRTLVRMEPKARWDRSSPLSEAPSPSSGSLRPATTSWGVKTRAFSMPTKHNDSYAGATTMPGTAQASSAQRHHRLFTLSPTTTVIRCLSKVEGPHLVARETMTSRLRSVTSQRQRRFSEAQEHENAYHVRNRRPQTTIRTGAVTATTCVPWSQPLGVKTVLQEQKLRPPFLKQLSSDNSDYGVAMIASTSPSRCGNITTHREWGSAASHATDYVEQLVKLGLTQKSPHAVAGAASESGYNLNGIELVHSKLRTRTQAAF
ncbi:hypothetical protein JKF63_07271 [Porcisia hertigi]|uniref:Uncharacterized protein n=1 Tax=Porcisia hertigi TaxID=2761500 RepID=A0A836LL96_9TRYP|nr:hypothetical protein JKF63_07271 [Porcisia hertigi]